MRASIRVTNELLAAIFGLPENWRLWPCRDQFADGRVGETTFIISDGPDEPAEPVQPAKIVYQEVVETSYGNRSEVVIHAKLITDDGGMVDFGERPLFAGALLTGKGEQQ